jgi:predicted ATPase
MMPSQRWHNIRKGMVADGASSPEIDQALLEVEAEEASLDPHARARKAGIPALYLGAAFEDLEEDSRRPAVEAAQAWARAWDGRRSPTETSVLPGLYLWSSGDGDDDETGFGTGKTLLAAAAAQAIQQGTSRLRWINVVREMTNLNFPFAHPTYVVAAHRMRKPERGEVVVLDDIDKQPPTDRNIQPIFALLHDCVGDRIPLLITANRDPDALQRDWGARFGHAAASRIIEHCLDVEVKGRDRRLPA